MDTEGSPRISRQQFTQVFSPGLISLRIVAPLLRWDAEYQRHRASGLNLVVAAIVLWNTVYLERAISLFRSNGQLLPDELLAHLSPLGWEHINLTGDYVWSPDGGSFKGRFRPLRSSGSLPPEPP
jgi:hypothetical protein